LGGQPSLPNAGSPEQAAGEAGANPLAGGAVVAGSGGEGGDAAAGAAGAGGAGGEAGTPSIFPPVAGRIELLVGPLQGAVVTINGISTTTGEDGSFTIENVPPQYDLTLVSSVWKYAQVLEGLTARDPVLVVPYAVKTRAGGVAGRLSGAGVPIPALNEGRVAFVSPETGPLAYPDPLTLYPDDDSYSVSNPTWRGSTTTTGDLLALVWEMGPVAPKSFTGFARQQVTLMDQQTLGSQDGSLEATNLHLSKPSQRTITGTLEVEDGSPDPGSFLRIGPFMILLDLKPGAFSLVVPDLAVPVALEVFSSGVTLQQVYSEPPSTGTWQISLPQLPELLLPAENADVDLESEFSWTGVPANATVLSTWFIDGWLVQRLTRATHAKIPNLTAYSPNFGTKTIGWRCEVWGPAASSDEGVRLHNAYLRGQAQGHWHAFRDRTFQQLD
jgi:hypothetical protein